MGTVRPSCRKALSLLAQVAELVDALASGASGRKVVGVQVSPWAPTQYPITSNIALKPS